MQTPRSPCSSLASSLPSIEKSPLHLWLMALWWSQKSWDGTLSSRLRVKISNLSLIVCLENGWVQKFVRDWLILLICSVPPWIFSSPNFKQEVWPLEFLLPHEFSVICDSINSTMRWCQRSRRVLGQIPQKQTQDKDSFASDVLRSAPKRSWRGNGESKIGIGKG